MKKLIVLNHKMSMLYDDVYYYIEQLNNIDTENDIIVCPSNIYLEAFLGSSDYPIGSQDVCASTDVNNTGEISTDQLKSLGVEYSMVGHFERHENSTVINEKLLAVLDANVFPILCFGEGIDEDYREVIPNKLDAYLRDIKNIQFIIFVYEPEYALDTGTLPKEERINEVTKFISKYLEDKYHQKPNLLYGGGVDSSNVKDILSIDSINGVVIGSISSDIKEVHKIINNIS